MIAKAEGPPNPYDTPEPTEHSDEGHLPSVSSCSLGTGATADASVRCTFALTHPEHPCPATAIESLLLMQDNGIPAIVSLLNESSRPACAQARGLSPACPTSPR